MVSGRDSFSATNHICCRVLGNRMARTPKDITDSELALLNAVWENDRPTARDLADVLYLGQSETRYLAVQKRLEQLELNKFVKRNRKPWPHRFEPNVSRDELIDWRLQDTAESLCGGDFSPLLLHLLKRNVHRLSELRLLLADLEKKEE